MNILYLLKILNTNKVSELVEAIDAPPIDFNLALWEAEARGEIEISKDKEKIKALKEAEPSCDEQLASKLVRVLQHFWSKELNMSRGRLNTFVKEPLTNRGYDWHEYLMALRYLIDTGVILEQEVSVPKTPKRPYHKFIFLCSPENPNEEWNAREVNKWIARMESSKVK